MSRQTSRKKKMTKKMTKKKESEKQEQPFWYNFPLDPEYMKNEAQTLTKSWRWPSRQCPTTSKSQRPTLVEFHNRYIKEPRWDPDHYCNYVNAPTQKLRVCNLIKIKGKFYGTSLEGSAVVLEEEGKEKDGSKRFGITRVGKNAVVPSEASRHFLQYMFEFDGEIMVVLLVSRESIEVVDDVEVFRLDVEKLLWVKVGRIGNRALFVGDKYGSMWAEACEMGFKRDCVYFINEWVDDDDWMVFDMRTGKISPIGALDA